MKEQFVDLHVKEGLGELYACCEFEEFIKENPDQAVLRKRQ